MRTVVLTFDDTLANHHHFVAPLLRKRGFGATFYISFFPEEWQAKHRSTLMSWDEIGELASWGFEIGNHTLNHDMGDCWQEQFDLLENEFLMRGLGPSRTFAYPGGPYHAAMAGYVKSKGLLAARIVDPRPVRKDDDPFALPAYSISDENPGAFEKAMNDLTEDSPVVLLYHGVPDVVHPWVNTPPEVFQKNMETLQGCRVLSMADFAAEYFK